MTRKLVYKVMTSAQWLDATARGAFDGSSDDVRDGFIHMSAGDQLRGTLLRHFQAQPDLLLIAFTALDLGGALQWDVSRGGDLFPHLYAPLETRHALWTKPLTIDCDGVPQVPEDIV